MYFPLRRKVFIFIFLLLLIASFFVSVLINNRETIIDSLQKVVQKKEQSRSSYIEINFTKFYFVSYLPDYKIETNSVNTTFFADTLSKLGLVPFFNVPYVLGNAKNPTISPKQVEVHFYPITQYEQDRSKDKGVITRTLSKVENTENGLEVIYVAGMEDDKTKKLIVPVYIDTTTKLFMAEPELSLTGYALLSLFYTFHTPPLFTNNGNANQEFMNKVGFIREKLFQLSKSSQTLYLEPFNLKKISHLLIPKAHAQCTGNTTCGTSGLVYRCTSGPYAGTACNQATGSPCPGSCVGSPTCTSNGVTLACAASGASCVAGTCASCMVSNSCAGTPVFTYCDRNGPGTNRCADVNVGTACENGGTCQISVPGAVTECICVGGATPTPNPCGIGQIFCGGCINGCRANTLTCNTWIANECSGSTPVPTSPPPTSVPPTGVPPTAVPPTGVPMTAAPTANPPTPPPNPPIVNLLVNGSDFPPAITAGGTVNTSWTVSNATNCYAYAAPDIVNWVDGSGRTAGNSSQAGVGPFATGSTTVSLVCNGPGGSASDSVVVQATSPPLPPTVSMTVDYSSGPLAVTSGTSVTVRWSVSNAATCTSGNTVATGNWTNGGSISAATGTNTQVNVGTITSNRTLSVSCSGPGGSANDSVDLTIAAGPAVSVDLKVNGSDGPVSVTSGNNVNVSWTGANAVNPCSASASVATTNWSGSKSQSGGSQNNVGPIVSTRTLTITCPGNGGTQSSDSVQINLLPAPTATPPPPPLIDLKINGQDSLVVAPNANVTATWDTTNAISCVSAATVATGNWVNNASKTPGIGQSQANVGPIASGRTLSLTCENSIGVTQTDNVPITLATPTPTPGVGQCQAPPPRDPPVTDCATGPADTVGITWQWDSVAIANQYQFSVQDVGGAIVYGPVILPAAGTCVAGLCSVSTTHLPGSYRSRISASNSTNVCSPSTVSVSNYITIPLCSAVNPPTVTLLVNGSSGPVPVTSGDDVVVTWTTTDASVCTASATTATTNWSGIKSISGTQSGCGPITSSRTLTLTCDGPEGTAADSVDLTVTGPPQCGVTLHDPPTSTCAGPPTNTGTITWEWEAIGGLVTHYNVTIFNQATNAQVITSGNQPAAFFATAGAPCNAAGALCRYITTHAPGATSYYSVIQSMSIPAAACTTATSAPSSPESVSACPGTFEARARRVSTADVNNCSAAGTTLAASMSISGINGIVPPGIQNTGATYSTWPNVPVGTYTLSSTAAAGYMLQNACVARNAGPTIPENLTQALASNETVSYDLLYTFGTPWSRGQDGEMKICTDIASQIPTLANPNPEFVLPGPGGYPGIVSYGTSYDFDGSGGGAGFVSSTDWLANEAISSMCTTNWYQYFSNKLDAASLTPVSNPPGLKSKNDFPNEINVINGDITLGGGPGSWNLGANERKIIIVNGNVTINTNISVGNRGFFALIVNGNIVIAPTVGTDPTGANPDDPSMEGLFVTSPTGRFITGTSTNNGTEKLVVRGTVIAGGFTLQRDLDSVNKNQDTPAEDFIYDPELLLTMPESFKDLRVKWEEVAP